MGCHSGTVAGCESLGARLCCVTKRHYRQDKSDVSEFLHSGASSYLWAAKLAAARRNERTNRCEEPRSVRLTSFGCWPAWYPLVLLELASRSCGLPVCLSRYSPWWIRNLASGLLSGALDLILSTRASRSEPNLDLLGVGRQCAKGALEASESRREARPASLEMRSA